MAIRKILVPVEGSDAGRTVFVVRAPGRVASMAPMSPLCTSGPIRASAFR